MCLFKPHLLLCLILASLPIESTFAASCTIDASSTDGGFGMAVAGVSQTLVKTSGIAINCDASISFKLGVTAGNHYAGATHYLSDGVHANIPYSIQQSGVAFGDLDITAYDPSYAASTTQNAANLTNSGTFQTVSIDFVATVPNGQGSGIYTDSVSFVVAWP